MAASVVSTSISEIAPTAVVLPTPNPPAMTIFTGMGGRPSGSLDLVKSTDHPLNDLGAAGRIELRPGDRQVPAGDQVADENPRDAEVQPQPAGHLGHGVRFLAQFDDVVYLELQVGEVAAT